MRKWLIPLLVVLASLGAEEPDRTMRECPTIRELPSEAWQEICEQKTQQEQTAAPQVENSHAAMAQQAKAVQFLHAGALHHPEWVSLLGDIVQLEDGSQWTVHPSDRYKTINWMTQDIIKIVPNDSWFSSYQFRLRNENTAEIIDVNLALRPLYNGLYTHWIIDIDPWNGWLRLEDGSYWNLCSYDYSVYKNWVINDTLIIGDNEGWTSINKPSILINMNIVPINYSRAKFVY